MGNKTLIVFAVIALALAGLACSFGGAAKAPQVVATVQAAATEVKGALSTSTPEPTSKPGAAPTSTPSSGGGEGPLSLGSRQSGLDKLKSYRIKFTFEWKSTETGKTDSGGMNWTEEYSSDPQGLHWTMSSQDSKTPANNIEFWQIGNTTYMQTTDQGKAQCFSFSSDDQKNQLTKGLFSPDMLGNVSDARYVGAETVNNIKTKHYKYDDKAATLTVFGQVTGDIWVAVDGGYVVKEDVKFTGGRGLFSASASKGDGKWLWELTDANQSVAVQAPDNCGGAGADLPVMKDATEKTSLGDMITYKSPSKLADVVAFYQKEMPAAGWKAEGNPQITDELAQLEFSKGGQTASLMLSVESGKTMVLITVTQ